MAEAHEHDSFAAYVMSLRNAPIETHPARQLPEQSLLLPWMHSSSATTRGPPSTISEMCSNSSPHRRPLNRRWSAATGRRRSHAGGSGSERTGFMHAFLPVAPRQRRLLT